MRNGRLGLGLGFGGVVWLAVLVGCGASTNSAAKTTTAAKVATPAPALVYQLPEDPLAAVPAGVLLAGRMRVEDFDKAAELASLRQMLQDFLSRPDTPELARFVRAHAKEIGIGFGFDAGGEIRLSLVASGDFSGWQNTAQGAELRDLGHGARALVMKQAAASDKEPSILVLDGHHIAMLDPTLVDATLATLSDPKRSALSQSGLAAMVQSSGFHQASAALALDTSSPQIRERAASDPRLAGFMELLDRVTGLEAELFLDANGVRIVGQLHTRSADAAAIFAKILKLGFAQQQGALSKLDITARDSDVVFSWAGPVGALTAIVDKLREEDVDKQEREQLAKAIADTRARTYPDQYADDAHWNAELGWLLVRNGQLEDGFALLERAPLAPARMGTKLFPNADSDDKYRELYLAALERLSHKLDATHIALAHIFTHHVAKKVQLDPVLLAEVERLSATKDGTVYLDAVAHLRYHEKSYDAARDAYEKLISVIEKRKLKFSDKEQLSHLYYDAGCMASLTGQLDLAKRRATKALQLWPLMYGNMAMDPDFNALRDSMGSAAFEQAFRPKDATAKPAH